MNEAIWGEAAQLLLRERLEQAKRARIGRRAMRHRALCNREQRKPGALQATCRRSGQAAY